MIRHQFVAALTATFVACSTPQSPEQQFTNAMLDALGGRAAVEALPRFLTIEGRGVSYNLGQDMQPEARTQTFEISEYRRVIDIAERRQRIEQTRTPKFAYFQGPQPQRQIQALDGAVAFNVNAAGQATRAAAAAEADRRIDFYHHPLTMARALTVAGTKVSSIRNAGSARQADVDIDGMRFTVTLDPGGVPLSISTNSSHPNLGDVVLTTTFNEYQDVGGVRLPAQFASSVDEFTVWQLQATRQAFSADGPDLTASADVAAQPAAAPAPNVTAEAIGKGVWLLAGQSHHSALIEFADHLMLIDAPQSEARTLAVIAKAKELVNNKPLTQLVTTHHHFDHTAGLRAAIAEGMTVITHSGNRAWVEAMARRPHTRRPDALAKNATRLEVQGVDDQLEVRDPLNTVVLYHVAGNPHSDTMLMAYIPRDRVIIQVDAFSPGAAANPYAANLLENIQKRNLRVDKIVPLHGAIAPIAELQKVVATKGN